MALPNQVDPSTPLVGDQVGQGDDQIRAFKQAFCDITGTPTATNVSNAYFTASAAGLLSVVFQNSGANPAVAGQMMRNAANLLWHDGTAARTLLNSLNGAVPLAAGLVGNMAGDYSTTSTTFVDVDLTNLKATVTIPTGAKQAMVFLSCFAKIGTSAGSETKLQVIVGSDVLISVYNNNTIFGSYVSVVAFGVKSNPTAGAGKVISLQYRNAVGGSVSIFNGSATESAQTRAYLGYAITM